MKDLTNKKIRAAYFSHWKSLHPGLQHTLVGDLVLSNQFEPLVAMSEAGVSIPYAAKSWDISSDYKTFKFRIDTSKKFSDGSNLKSSDFKRSWEDALALDPQSTNSSLLDILYRVKGFENFKDTKTLSGISAIDDETLVVEFKLPFRMALDHLQGNRFAAFKQLPDGKYIGTGHYVITELDADALLFSPNPYSPILSELNPVEVFYLQTTEALKAIQENKLDILVYGRGSDIVEGEHVDNVEILTGQESINDTVNLNSLPGRIFSQKKFRVALQELFFEFLSDTQNSPYNKNFFNFDFQLFLPFQKGRIAMDKASSLIKGHGDFVKELKEFSLKKPIIFYYQKKHLWILDMLKKNEIQVSSLSKGIRPEDLFAIIYKTSEPDIIVSGVSVVGGDPDGIYHRLGKSGAIALPMTKNKTLEDMVEQGRGLTDGAVIDLHYQKISEAFLQEVPYVHLGFTKAVSAHSADRIEIASDTFRRNQGQLHIYKLK